MQLKTLITMLEVASSNAEYKSLSDKLMNLARQVVVDPELDDDITIDSFNNEFYDVKSLRYIKQCFNFRYEI